MIQQFPAVDPIPLPAPVWLMKLLHIVTLALHFVAVEMLIGGLLLAIVFSLIRMPASMVVARAIARRLPVVMTFLINFGVPPLLFAQVLYGRALYTSSILIGVYWIAIILLLMLAYRSLYSFSALLDAGKAWMALPRGVLSFLIVGAIARILSSNMTLMLRPEAWRAMYQNSAAGLFLPAGDPTLTPRWLLMMVGGLAFGGLWMLYLASRSTFVEAEKKFLAGVGGAVAAVFGVAYLLAGIWALSVQPDAVKAGLVSHPLYHLFAYAEWGWVAGVALIVVLGLRGAITRKVAAACPWAAMAVALVTALSLVVFRDAVRDLTLLSKGFDVWDRVVVSNWGVIGLFLALFVGGLGVAGWLISVVARAKKTMESEA